MPRLSEQFRENRRRTIEQAAFGCFAKRGFEATSMEDIVAASGLSGPAVYRYVRSKEDLMLAATVESVDQVDRALAALLDLDPVPGPTAALDVIMKQFDARTRELGFDVSALIIASWSHVVRKPAVQPIAIEARGGMRKIVLRLARAWEANGQIPPGSDVRTAALSFSLLIPSLLIERHLAGPNVSARRFMRGLAAISAEHR